MLDRLFGPKAPTLLEIELKDALLRAEARFDNLMRDHTRLCENIATTFRQPTDAKAPALEPAAPDLPPIVADAVKESTRGLSREVANATRAKAKALLAAGTKPEDVAKLVRDGEKVA